ncbi:MAG: 8-amino-7-oxononanoate synthase [Colwellia sp.]|nr:8-amino-7-oxononanoate synthase [Colwellia sp.]MCW8864620.1 8-amino-7-oxononanoate synthase [Colwellia sp.]MCW9081587.1 8-amino-7-oxononanoate synthase [Colwellia sp.]
MAFDFIKDKLAAQQASSLYRQRVCIQQHGADDDAKSHISIDGKAYINFSSNDYLGLNNHPDINKAMQEGLDKFGLSGCSSNLVTGFHYAHQALEDTICQWLNKPKCLLFSSGFAANMAFFQALGQSSATSFFLDKLSHASMLDGAFSSKAAVKRFAHNDIMQLSELLTKSASGNKLIASEGVFSMDGDQAKLIDLSALATTHDASLFIDDAHSIGVIGEQGQGSNSIVEPDVTMATFGKAIATSGAFLACDEKLHDYLINFARHYIYSTAISPALAWATIKSIELIKAEQWRRDKIIELSHLLTDLLDPSINIIKSQSSIQAIIIGDEDKALNVSEQLNNAGLWVTAIRPPTVAKGTSRLRVTVCANHNINNIKALAYSLNKALC